MALLEPSLIIEKQVKKVKNPQTSISFIAKRVKFDL